MKPLLYSCLLLYLVGKVALANASFCAVKLSVFSSTGEPVPSAVAILLGPTGSQVERQLVKSGRAEFCDFGFGEHSIRIEAGECQPVVIGKVRLRFRHPQILSAVLNCYGEGDGSGNACFTYIRVLSDNSKGLGGVLIRSGTSEWVTDDYGRAMVSVRKGETRIFTFFKSSLRSESISLTCSENLVGEAEIAVTMKNSK